MNKFWDWGQRMDGRKNSEYQNSRITKPPETWIAPICSWIYSKAFLKHFSTTFQEYLQIWFLVYLRCFPIDFATLDLFWSISQSHLCKEGHVYAFLLTMQLWIYSKTFLKHISITSLQKRTCTCLSINYAALDLFWSISEALFNHISAMKDVHVFLLTCSLGSILKHFWSTFQSRLCKEGHIHAFLLVVIKPLLAISPSC
jgi:hypothetical protein